LIDEDQLGRSDARMRRVYDRLAPLHDPVLALTFRGVLGGTVEGARDAILARLGAQPGERVLEVGAGTGRNALRLARHGVDYVGVDLAPGMIRRARRRLDGAGFGSTPLAVADAHHLPLPDASFDRVFHVGAVNSFADPTRALAEMSRVCRPGGMLLLVDEELAPDAGLLTRLAFRASIFYTTPAACSAPDLWPGAAITSVERLTDFFYLLTARADATARP
jgi:ubiquinone/menaquinone biosynthesis C-methylase UbiE